MNDPLDRRLRVAGWGNLILGFCIPVRVGIQVSAALAVCSFSYDGKSFTFLILLGLVFAILTGFSGWGVLKGRAWARGVTCFTGGMTLGYAGVGNVLMTVFGPNRGLDITIRHGSLHWWHWSMSHFQNPVVLEGPWMIWWIFCLWALLKLPKPIGPHSSKHRPAVALGPVFGAAITGGIIRLVQIGLDVTLLSSQR